VKFRQIGVVNLIGDQHLEVNADQTILTHLVFN